jgi:nucleoside-diphosphate-sugar epimerase
MEVAMRIFVAGGSGTIGVPLVRALVAAGHEVTALTRLPGKASALRSLGAKPAIADALNRDALIAAVVAAQPTHIIHQLTALPKEGPRSAKDVEATNRLRIEGTRNLLEAAAKAGARRFIVGSFAMLSPRGRGAESGDENPAAVAVRSMEDQVMQATAAGLVEGVILRYGMFYSLETPSTVKMIELVRKRRLPVLRGDTGQLPLIHLDDAVSATVAALDRAPAGSVYDIVDDRAVSMTEIVRTLAEYTGSSSPLRIPGWIARIIAPYLVQITSMRMPLSNAKAKAEFGWQPKYPTLRDGMNAMLPRAA